MLIGVGTKKIGETAILPLLKQMGFTPDQYLYYHGESADTMKKAVMVTNKEWRNVIAIIATTTIEVAINIEHNFHSRWLFTSSHGLRVSLSSELMQLLARVPRGPNPAARAAQLADHRIYVVFDGEIGVPVAALQHVWRSCSESWLANSAHHIEGGFTSAAKRARRLCAQRMRHPPEAPGCHEAAS